MDSGHKSGSKYRLIWVVYECLGMDLRACELWGMCVEHVGHTCTLGGTCRAQAIGLGWALVPKKLFTSKCMLGSQESHRMHALFVCPACSTRCEWLLIVMSVVI